MSNLRNIYCHVNHIFVHFEYERIDSVIENIDMQILFLIYRKLYSSFVYYEHNWYNVVVFLPIPISIHIDCNRISLSPNNQIDDLRFDRFVSFQLHVASIVNIIHISACFISTSFHLMIWFECRLFTLKTNEISSCRMHRLMIIGSCLFYFSYATNF